MDRLGPWNAGRRVAVAVSGGADSLCLAWLAARWGRPVALIVDHGLRADSAREANEAAARLAGFGVPSRILTLRVPRGPGLAARARTMRYAALTGLAASDALTDLLLGHHAGDQAETVLLRRDARSGPAGLSGMAACMETSALRMVRPLLAVAPGRLRAVLRRQGIDWVEDPSNADPSATRTRMRGRLTEDGLMRQTLAEALAAARSRTAQEGRIAEILARRATLSPFGHAVLTPGPIEPDALAALLRMLGGTPYPPRGAALARLATCPAPGTLAGVRLMPAGRLGPGLLLVREPAALEPPIPAASGVVWDGRFQLHMTGDCPDGTLLGALGSDAPPARDVGLPSAVLRTLPALRAPGGVLAVPHLGYFCGWTNRSVGLTFCPQNPACGAPFRVLDQGDAEAAPAPHVLGDAAAALPD